MLGHLLKHARQRKRISVKTMADLMGVDEATVRKLESTDVGEFLLREILRYLNGLHCVLYFIVNEISKKSPRSKA